MRSTGVVNTIKRSSSTPSISTFAVRLGTGLGKAGRQTLGTAFDRRGQSNKAIEFYTKSLNICREFGIRTGEGRALGNLGSAFDRRGQHDKAIEFFTNHLNICRDLEDRAEEGRALGNLEVGRNRKNASVPD